MALTGNTRRQSPGGLLGTNPGDTRLYEQYLKARPEPVQPQAQDVFSSHYDQMIDLNIDRDPNVLMTGIKALHTQGNPNRLPTVDEVETAGREYLKANEPGYVETVGKGIVRGFQGMAQGINEMARWGIESGLPLAGALPMGKLIDQETRTKWAQPFKEGAEYWRRAATEGVAAPDPQIFGGTFFENPSFKRAVGIVSEAVPSLAAAIVTGGATGSTFAGALMLGGLEGAPQYGEARAKGKSVDEASLYGALSVAGTTLLEYLPISRMFKRSGGFFRGAAHGVVEEGIQEPTQQLWQNVIAKIGYDPAQDLAEGIIEAFIGGAGSGGLAGGTVAKLNQSAERARNGGVTNDEYNALWTDIANQVQGIPKGQFTEILEVARQRASTDFGNEALQKAAVALEQENRRRFDRGYEQIIDDVAGLDKPLRPLRSGATLFEDIDERRKEVGREPDVAPKDVPLEGRWTAGTGRKAAIRRGKGRSGGQVVEDVRAEPKPIPEKGSVSKQIDVDFVGRWAGGYEVLKSDRASEAEKEKILQDRMTQLSQTPDTWVEPLMKKHQMGRESIFRTISKGLTGQRLGKRQRAVFDSFREWARKKQTNLDNPQIQEKIARADLKEMNDDAVSAVISSLEKSGNEELLSLAKDEKAFRETMGEKKAPQYSTKPFYSQLQRVVEFKLPARGTGQSIKNTIESWSKKGEFKKEELESVGLTDWLDARGKDKVNKEEVVDFLNKGGVKVEEILKEDRTGVVPGVSGWRESHLDNRWDTTAGDVDLTINRQVDEDTGEESFWAKVDGQDIYYDQGADTFEQAIEDIRHYIDYDVRTGHASSPEAIKTKFGQYQLPDGENYRELLITLPVQMDPQRVRYRYLSGLSLEEITPEEKVERDELRTARERGDFKETTKYTSSHWDEPNVLAHIRFNDRTVDGNKTLFIEEVQSDWHQEGRKKGYGTKEKTYKIRRADGSVGMFQYASEEEARSDIEPGDSVEVTTITSVGPPDAPFKSSWPLLAMKRAIRWAAENGYDKVAWTPGEVQADRYDLSKHISEVMYNESERSLHAYDLKGEPVLVESNVSPDKIEDYIGKEAAQRLLDQKYEKITTRGAEGQKIKRLKGQDLVVGGEGMKGFYDKILPSEVNKYIKRWGAKVGVSEVSTEGNKKQEVWSFDVTPQMRESVMQGQPLFKAGQDKQGQQVNLKDVQNIFKGQKVGVNPDGSFWIQTKSGHGLEVKNVDKISPDKFAFEVAYGRQFKGEMVAGAYQSGKIEISKMGDKWTLQHETSHWLEDTGILSPMEVSMLRGHIRKLARQGRFTPENSDAIGRAEDRANFIADQLNKEPQGTVGKIIGKVREWIDKFVNLFTRTPQGIVRDIESGKVYERGGEQAKTAEPQYTTEMYDSTGRIIENSKAFRKWFGDSKVVDDQGRPLVVYHGSPNMFEAFDPNRIGEEYRQDEVGFFFTDYKKTGEKYARNKPTGLPREKPGTIYETYVSIKNPLVVKIDYDPINEWDSRHKELSGKALQNNNDGIIIKADKYESLYIPFSPNKIKSVYNRGTWDASDPRIQYSVRLKDMQAAIEPFIDKAKKKKVIDTSQYYKKTGIQLPTSNPQDLNKWFRRIQTMQDMARNYPKMKRLFDTEVKRGSDANQQSVKDKEKTDPYFTLSPQSREKVNFMLLQGDQETKVFDDGELRAQGFTSEEIKGYQSIRKILDEKLDILVRQMITHALDENQVLSEAMIKAIRRGRDVEKMEKQLKKAGYKTGTRKRLSWIANWVAEREGYIPHKWDSEWVVRVNLGKGEQWLLEVPTVLGKTRATRRGRQESANEAAIREVKKKLGLSDSKIQALADEGKVKLIKTRDLPVELFQGARMDVIASIVQTATDNMHAQYVKDLSEEHQKEFSDIRDKLKKTVEELYLAKGWGRHLMGRKGVKGYREDLENVLAEYLYGFNAFVAKGEAARNFAQAMKDINPTQEPEQWRHGKEFISDMLGESSEAGWFKKYAGLYFLAGDLSAAVLNMTQNWTHAVPLLRGIKGNVSAERQIASAMKDIAGEYADARKSKRKVFTQANKYISQEEIDALRQAYERGLLDPVFLGEVTGFHPNKMWQAYSQKFWDVIFKLFTGAEGWNRTSTFLAAYRRSKDIDKAIEVVQGAHFQYGRGNRPDIVRKTGAVGNIAYTYMTYPMNNLVFLKHRAQDVLEAVHQGDKEAVKTGLRVLGSHMAYAFAFGGVMGLPFAWLGEWIFKLFTEPEDDWELWLNKKLPKPVSTTISRGIPASLLGNDMSWRIQGTDVLGIPVGFQVIGTAKRRAEQAWRSYKQGENWDVLFHLAPDLARNPIKAVIGFTEGGTRRGVPPVKYTTGEAITRGLGFSPTREAEAYKSAQLVKEKKADRNKKLQDFAERLMVARQRGNTKAIKELMKDVTEYNRKERKKGAAGVPIPWKTINSSAKKRLQGKMTPYGENIPDYMRGYQREVRLGD